VAGPGGVTDGTPDDETPVVSGVCDTEPAAVECVPPAPLGSLLRDVHPAPSSTSVKAAALMQTSRTR
jgi:hypothetical protein